MEETKRKEPEKISNPKSDKLKFQKKDASRAKERSLQTGKRREHFGRKVPRQEKANEKGELHTCGNFFLNPTYHINIGVGQFFVVRNCLCSEGCL